MKRASWRWSELGENGKIDGRCDAIAARVGGSAAEAYTARTRRMPMKALVVYESLWGNTAAIARAIADGIGPDARAVTTVEATGELLAGAELIIAGAPVIAFSLPTEGMRDKLAADPGKAPTPPDLSHPSMRSWLDALPVGHGRAAAFETRIWWSPRGAVGAIDRGLQAVGYRRASKPQKFIVEGTYGPLRDGELERARSWGQELAGEATA